jgi:predicted aminopeptidase
VNRKRWVLLSVTLTVVLVTAAACSPMYVIKAGIAEAKILRARRPIPDVIQDPTTSAVTRGKLSYVLEARRFAAETLALNIGDSYTSFTQLESDTLALVLSAAHRDRLASRTWWFPVVGNVPYKGYFSESDARDEQAKLEASGLDTYLRPTSAFSTLGWFADPLLSSLLRNDEVELVETVLHELTHNHLFVPSSITFNESFATFVGRTAAIQFFCTRPGSGPDSVKCLRAQERWRDYQRFGVFIDGLVDALQTVYGDDDLSYDQKVAGRDAIFVESLARFESEVMPTFEGITFRGFLRTPLNNATLLSRIRYYHRLPDFQRLLEDHGGVAAAIDFLAEHADEVDDPFDLLPTSDVPVPAAAAATATAAVTGLEADGS